MGMLLSIVDLLRTVVPGQVSAHLLISQDRPGSRRWD